MKRDTLNYVLDLLAFLTMSAVLSTGLMLKYLLPHGRGPGLGGGMGAGFNASFLGLGRHDWGEVHFYLSLVLIFVVALHLIIHWRWIAAMAWGSANKNRSRFTKSVFVSTILLFVLMIILPFAIGLETKEQINPTLSQAAIY